MSDHVAVMYRGRVVEEGPTEAVLTAPQNDYTALLLAARPGAGRATQQPSSAMTLTTKTRSRG